MRRVTRKIVSPGLRQANGDVQPNLSHETSTFHTPHQKMFLNLNEFRRTEEFCDVKLVVDEVKFPAHRTILAAFSSYFKAAFSGGFAESKEPCVEIKSVDASTMEFVLDYAYSGKCSINFDNVFAVMHAANFFELNHLFQQCCTFLINNMKPENCLSIYCIAQTYQCPNLEIQAKDYFLRNFDAVCKDVEFCELDFEMLVDLIGNDSLMVKTETDEYLVCEAVLNWLKYKEKERLTYSPKVLAQVRLAHVPTSYLHDRLESLNLVRDSAACMNMLNIAQKYKLFPKRRMELQCSLTRFRRGWSKVEVMLMYVENPEKQTKNLIGVADDGRIVSEFIIPPDGTESFIVSNCQAGVISVQWSNLYRFYFTTSGHSSQWNSMSANPRARNWFGLVELDANWYIIGGMNTEKVSDYVDKYTESTATYTSLEPLPIPVYYPSVVTMRGLIYVLGGFDAQRNPTNAVQRYDPSSNKWTQLTPVPIKRGEVKACVINDRIFVCHFFDKSAPVDKSDDSRNIFVYDVFKDKWETCSKLCHPFFSGPVAFNGNMFVLTKRTAEEYVLELYTPFPDFAESLDIAGSWKEFAECKPNSLFSGYRPRFIAGPLLISRPQQEYDPNGPLNVLKVVQA